MTATHAERPPDAAPDAWSAGLPASVAVVGHRLHPIDLARAAEVVAAAAWGSVPRLVVTLNPEIVVRAREDAALAAAVARADLVVADGVGLVWAARRAGSPLPGRVPGVDLACAVMARGGADLRVFFLGGRAGVAERAAAGSRARGGVTIAGARDGYFAESDAAVVAQAVGDTGAHLLLAGLGERQERFLDDHRARLRAGALIGVGGTLDVLAGEVQRTPAWTRRVGLEWAWRVGLDPSRWHRVPRLLRFVGLVLRAPG